MDLYKKAAFERIRVKTDKGLLSAEELCTLSTEELNKVAVGLDAEIEKSPKKSFLSKVSVDDKKLKLKFDLVLDILQTKAAAEDEAATALETKKHNAQILELISAKKDEALKGKSIEELLAMLK